ncbi:MAG: hypothetical protein ACRDZN_04460, partial [Acidimicrobiales bacterium]
TRDTHAWLVLAVTGVALLAAFAGIATRRAARRVVWPLPVWACLAAVSALAVLGILSANHGQRSDFPTRNVYQTRILPYPDRAAWFADHGMPQEDQFVGPYRRPTDVEPGMPPLLLVPEDDPAMAEWNDWVASDGAATLRLWALTHPWYVGTEPLRSPERVFNNAMGDRSFYAPVDQRTVPFVTELVFPSRPLAIAVAVGLAVWGLAGSRRRSRSPAFWVGATVIVAALPHAALSWHADGMETARHLVTPVLQLHLGLLLLLVDLVVSHPRRRGPRSAPIRPPWQRQR